MSEQPKVIKDRRGLGFVLMPAELTQWMSVQINEGIESSSTADLWRRLNSAAEADIKSGYLGRIEINGKHVDPSDLTVGDNLAVVDMNSVLSVLHSGSLAAVNKEALGEIIIDLIRLHRNMV